MAPEYIQPEEVVARGGGGLEIPATEYMPPPYFRDEKKESVEVGVIKELDPTKVLTLVRHYLKGEIWDEQQQKYVKFAQPLMNDLGIGKYLSILSACVSPLVTFGNYNKNEIDKLTLYVCDQAIPVIHVNYIEYGIGDKSNLPIVDMQIFYLTYAALKKAMGGGDRNVIGRTITESIMTRQGDTRVPQQPGKKSVWGSINPFSR